MILKTRVKVSGVHNLHDGRFCAGMGVEMIGFPIDSTSPNYVPPEKFEEIIGWLSGLKYVGEINDLSATDLNAYHLDYVEVTDPELINDLSVYQVPVILKIQINEGFTYQDAMGLMDIYKDDVAFFDIEGNTTLGPAHIVSLKKLAEKYPVFVGFGISEENIDQVLEEISPEGVSLKGGKEIKVGLNDFEGLAAVLEKLDTDEFA